MDNEVVMLDLETSEFIEGKVQGNETYKPMTLYIVEKLSYMEFVS